MKLKIPGKKFFHIFFTVAWSQSLPLVDSQGENYNLNVTEVRDSDLKKFSRNFQFHRGDPNIMGLGLLSSRLYTFVNRKQVSFQVSVPMVEKDDWNCKG